MAVEEPQMIKRVVTKIGDVFSVHITPSEKKYFQLIAFDLRQLNSDVIRAFSKVYLADESPSVEEIVRGDVDFYAHCVTKAGVKLDLWKKIGKSDNIGRLDHVLFRDTNDYGAKPEERVDISENWYVWRINDPSFTSVGRLAGENRRAEIGVVVSPNQIVNRIKTGNYTFSYPGFE
jgi:hypothetical protein